MLLLERLAMQLSARYSLMFPYNKRPDSYIYNVSINGHRYTLKKEPDPFRKDSMIHISESLFFIHHLTLCFFDCKFYHVSCVSGPDSSPALFLDNIVKTKFFCQFLFKVLGHNPFFSTQAKQPLSHAVPPIVCYIRHFMPTYSFLNWSHLDFRQIKKQQTYCLLLPLS